MPEHPVLAVVIPTLNEADYLPAVLGDLSALGLPTEVVVVDGGSHDDTVNLARRAGASVLHSARGRAKQLRAGAEATTAPWLFFLHADSRVGEATRRALESFVAADDRTRHAHFAFALEGRGAYWRFIELGVRVREALGNLVYGDQGLVVSREAYSAVGGHPAWPVMEDVGVLDRLRHTGEECRLGATLVTSPRRYETEGRVRTWLLHAALVALFRVGVSPERLARWRVRSGGQARRSLIVFAKAPRPGTVKTRLAADVGDTRAASIYREMGRQIVDGVRHGDYSVQVHFDPPGAEDEVASWLGRSGVSYQPQATGDLGSRMSTAFDAAFDDAEAVCIIGTDTPSVSATTIERAFQVLTDTDVVVGPAVDGGYYLLALKQPCPALFSDIEWSTTAVLETTLQRVRDAGLSFCLLEAATDVDTLADVPPHLLAT